MRVALAILVAVMATAALARDDGRYQNADPKIKDWIRGLRSAAGGWCCDSADGFPAEAQYDTDTKGYRVFIEGAWYQIPDDKVIKEPNKLGYAMVWYGHIGGKPDIHCFIPGAGL